MAATDHWPVEIARIEQGRSLRVAFESGETFTLPAEFLRVSSPSAEVQGHTPAERKIPGGKKDVAILRVEPVGNYAVRLVFDDRHDSGYYTWDYLHELGVRQAELWQDYLEALASRNLAR